MYKKLDSIFDCIDRKGTLAIWLAQTVSFAFICLIFCCLFLVL